MNIKKLIGGLLALLMIFAFPVATFAASIIVTPSAIPIDSGNGMTTQEYAASPSSSAIINDTTYDEWDASPSISVDYDTHIYNGNLPNYTNNLGSNGIWHYLAGDGIYNGYIGYVDTNWYDSGAFGTWQAPENEIVTVVQQGNGLTW
jgi:hypothetical protein